MYPDKRDVEGYAPEAANEWQDVALAFHFITFAKKACYNHGTHDETDAADLKEIAEQYIGRKISMVAFLAGAKYSRLKVKRGAYPWFKFPPTERLGEHKEYWQRTQRAVESEIVNAEARLKQWG